METKTSERHRTGDGIRRNARDSALGLPGLGPTTLVGDCARSTVTAMQATGVRRLLVVGVAVLFEDDGILNAIARRTFLRNVARDSAEMERIVRAMVSTGPSLDRHG